MIIEYTVGQALIFLGTILSSIWIAGYFINRHEEKSYTYLIGWVITFFIFVIMGLNTDYGFLVFDMIEP